MRSGVDQSRYTGVPLVQSQPLVRAVPPQVSQKLPSVGTSTAGTMNRGNDEVDVVQFMAPVFYAHERSQLANVIIMRIGHLEGTCKVRYFTLDGSATAGDKYEHTEGFMIFEPGECRKDIEVKVLDNDCFDTTLSFELGLESPVNCVLEHELKYCRVMILDDDQFPSNKFKEQIAAGSDAALHKVGFSLLLSFISFTFWHVPTIAWKSVMMVLLAQLGNAYYWMTIILKVYLVDVCLNLNDDETLDQLLIPGDRVATGCLLAAIWTLPNFLLTAVDYFEMAVLEISFNIRKHLRVNLFRKYLNYTEDSRIEVPIQDLKTSMMEDIPDLVSSGYLILFDLFAMFGKIIIVAIFMLRKQPSGALPFVMYPSVMIIYLSCRYSQRLELLGKQGEGESDTQGWLIHADMAHRLIRDYKQRGFVVNRFEDVLMSQRALTMNLKYFNFWNNLLLPWITRLIIGVYMAIGSKMVLDGSCKLGIFLATINVYKDLGDRFEGIYEGLQELCKVIDPLAGLTGQFNLPTDLQPQFDTVERRLQVVNAHIEKSTPSKRTPIWDTLPIEFRNVKVNHIENFNKGDGLNLRVDQGKIVHIMGPHDSGKLTIVNLLTDNIVPANGEVFVPLHVRLLHVSYKPVLVDSLGLYGNLTFGASEHEKKDPERIRRLMRRLGLAKPWIMKQFEDEVAKFEKKDLKTPTGQTNGNGNGEYNENGENGESMGSERLRLVTSSGDESEDYSSALDLSDDEKDDGEADDDAPDEEWQNRLSMSELKRLQMVRAFHYNPEVMVLHRPVDETDKNLTENILSMLMEFVDNRGVEMDPADVSRRRPRTVFFTGGTAKKNLPISDYVWTIGPGIEGVRVEPGPRQNSTARSLR